MTSGSAPNAEPASTPLVLFNRYSQAISAVAGARLGPDRISNGDVGMLVSIRRFPGISPSELAIRTGVARSFASRRLKRFQDAGLVVRRIDPTDHRRFGLEVTNLGLESVDSFEALLGDWFVESAPQATVLLEALRSVRDPTAPGAELLSPLAIVTAMARAGQAYVADSIRLALPFGAANETDRYAISLISEAGELRPGALAGELGLAPSGVNSLLNRLESGGLIARTSKALESDRRAVSVHLTPIGRELAKTLIHNLDRHAENIAAVVAPAVAFATIRPAPRTQLNRG